MMSKTNKKKKYKRSSHISEIYKSYNEALEYLKEKNISISTITINCNINCKINLTAIIKTVQLTENGFVVLMHGTRYTPVTVRTIIHLKKKKIPKKLFFNQISVYMASIVQKKKKTTYIHVKIFSNGILHITGCKSMEDFQNMMQNFFKILNNCEYVKDPSKLKANDIRVRMINSGFKVDYNIDRKALMKILINKHHKNSTDVEFGYIECSYNPVRGHSPVNIKYRHDNQNKAHIFVFQTGSILITGVKTLDLIIKSYQFIMKLLQKYFSEIQITNWDIDKVNRLMKIYQRQKRNNS